MHSGLSERIERALRHARFGIWTIALTYGLSVFAGLAMVHSGNRFALDFRDNLVGKAQRESVILRQFQRGNSVAAAGMDAAGNAVAGLLSAISGYGVPAGYAVAAYRGWIGGVVSIDGAHRSRLATSYGAFYYLVTLLLQLVPYSLAGGAGVSMGIASFASESRTGYHGPRMPWLRIPYEAIRDAGWIYLNFASPVRDCVAFRIPDVKAAKDRSAEQLTALTLHYKVLEEAHHGYDPLRSRLSCLGFVRLDLVLPYRSFRAAAPVGHDAPGEPFSGLVSLMLCGGFDRLRTLTSAPILRPG